MNFETLHGVCNEDLGVSLEVGTVVLNTVCVRVCGGEGVIGVYFNNLALINFAPSPL